MLSCGLGVTPAGVKFPPGSQGQGRVSRCWGAPLSGRMATYSPLLVRGDKKCSQLAPSQSFKWVCVSSGLCGRQPSVVVTGHPHGYYLLAMGLGAD